AHQDADGGPGRAQLGDDAAQDVHGPQAGVDGAGTQPDGQGEAAVPLVDVQGQVLVLPEITVVATEGLVAVGGGIGGIDVEDQCRGRLRAGADKEIDQVAVEDLQTLGLGGADLHQDGSLGQGQLGLAAGEGVGKACQRAAGGEGLLGIGTDLGEDLE